MCAVAALRCMHRASPILVSTHQPQHCSVCYAGEKMAEEGKDGEEGSDGSHGGLQGPYPLLNQGGVKGTQED